jgi:hypothetical protein
LQGCIGRVNGLFVAVPQIERNSTANDPIPQDRRSDVPALQGANSFGDFRSIREVLQINKLLMPMAFQSSQEGAPERDVQTLQSGIRETR